MEEENKASIIICTKDNEYSSFNFTSKSSEQLESESFIQAAKNAALNNNFKQSHIGY